MDTQQALELLGSKAPGVETSYRWNFEEGPVVPGGVHGVRVTKVLVEVSDDGSDPWVTVKGTLLKADGTVDKRAAEGRDYASPEVHAAFKAAFKQAFRIAS